MWLVRFNRMRNITAFVFLVFLALNYYRGYSQNAANTQAYIARYKDIAQEEMERTGVPASITLGQGIIESVAGTSILSQKANNHFGIKCHEDWNGPTYYQDDDAKNECFRKYDKPEDSFRDHSDFLKSRPRYAFLFQLDPCDYKDWSYGLKKAGYATNPSYSQELIKAIEDNNLQQYDLGGCDKRIVSADSDKIKNTSLKKLNDTTSSSAPVSTNSLHDVFEFNNIRTILLKSGDTPKRIADEFKTRPNWLLRWNDMDENQVLIPGTKFYLQPKHNNGVAQYHIVQINETMFTISQSEGIKLSELYKKNLLQPGEEPAVGQKMFLKKKRTEPPELYKPDSFAPVNNNIDKIYVVQSGDSLFSIAKKFNLTIDELKQKNHLTNDNIRIGDRLEVQ
jgi:LysM repeat protein